MTTTTAHHPWKDLVKVNGSFYCNLTTSEEEEPLDDNRTVVRVGDEDVTGKQNGPEHTIKLVIGATTSTTEPLSLDTSEYVSWDGGSILAGHEASADSPLSDDQVDVDQHVVQQQQPQQSVVFLSATGTIEDELTHSCRQYFDHRQRKFLQPHLDDERPTARPSTHVELQGKMEHLRREIVSLVNQDDALFRQLLALNTSIHQLRSQSLQRRVRTLPSSRPRSAGHSSLLHPHQLSPSPSAASLTSLTSLSSGEEEVDEEETSAVLQPAPLQATSAALTRQRISYPPKARNGSSSQHSSHQRNNTSPLSRNSLNSSSSSSSSCSSYSPTWSVSSSTGESPCAPKSLVPHKTPRSPHSSFYSRTRTPPVVHAPRNHHDHPSDLLMFIHKRQGSYDSGIQGSEPSDAEVFV